MEKKRLIIDLARCVGCFNCLAACKDEFAGNSWLPYTDSQMKHDQKWIDVHRHERGAAPYTDVCYVPKLCNHCENADCEKAYPDAVKRRGDGIVLLDPEKAKGARALVSACPHGMISWNDELETAQKCTMCAHLLDSGWKEPRCVQACPLRAISIVSCGDAEFSEMIAGQELTPLANGSHNPRVMYKNLHRYSCCFISGALACEADGEERAASGAAVELYRNGELICSAETDFFGEFKIDRIPSGGGVYELLYYYKGYEPVRTEVTVNGDSVCLDVVRLGA